MSFKADLHVHSSVSCDGEIVPDVLVRMAADAGMRCIAVTDHNRVDALRTAVIAGRNAGVVVIPGIEIDCDFGDVHLHILGYGIDYDAPEYLSLWERVEADESAAGSLFMDRVEALGIVVDREKAEQLARDMGGFVIPEHIAEAVLGDSRNDGNALLAPFRPGGVRADSPFVNFYWDLCSAGKPAHVVVPYMGLEECVGLITGSGGVPVLAHPGRSLGGCPGCLADIAGCGVVGVEAYSNYHTAEVCLRWREEGERCGMFSTCGSDFHGRTKPAILIGGHGAGDDVEELLKPFFEAIA